jgi:biotin carboxylase
MRTVVLVAPYAMPNTLTYVEALLALRGVRPVVISSDPLERFPQHIRRALEYHEQVADCFSAEQVGAALKRIGPRCLGVDRVFGVLEQLQLAVAGARDIARIPGMGLAEVTRFRDKSVMKEMLRSAGVPCARHARVERAEDAIRFVEGVGYPVIVKPVDGLGTRSTWRVTNREELDKALVSMRPGPGNVWQIEEFLVGTEHSFETVTIDGRHIWSSSTNYLPGPLDAMENPWIQYCVILPRETDNLDRFRDVNHAALNALGMRTGLSHMEWFTRRDGSPAVNEVGARPPGVNIMPMMSLAHGVDFIKAWVRLMALDQFEPPTRTRAAGSAFLRGQGRGRVKAVHGLAKVREEVGRYIVDAKIPQPGTPKADGYEGEGHIIVAADTTAEVEHALARIIRTVRVELG